METEKDTPQVKSIDVPPETTKPDAAEPPKAVNGATVPEAPAPPTAFNLTREEHLELENIQLRGQLLKQQQAVLGSEQQSWADKVGVAHGGLDVGKYSIDLGTGACQLIQVGQPTTPAAPVPPPATPDGGA